ncbi:MAG: glycosyltransferase [Bacteroidota bacterium]
MISVLMPTYNCAGYIKGAIISILIQSYRQFEFLIIDDGSEDNTEAIVKSFRDDRINYIKKSHSGLSNSIDYGLSIAKFDLIARMDADDIAHPQRLELQINFLNSHPAIDVLSCWYAVFKNNKIEYLVKRSIDHDRIVQNLSLYPDICHPAVMFRKQKLLNAGGFAVEKEFDPFGDYAVWLRTKSLLKFHNLPLVLHYYRERADSFSSMDINSKRKLIYTIQTPYYKNNLEEEFGLTKEEAIINKGWREYLFGDVNLAVQYWKSLQIKLLKHPAMVVAILLKYLPGKMFFSFLGKRISQKLTYKLMFISNIKIDAARNLKLILQRTNNYGM